MTVFRVNKKEPNSLWRYDFLKSGVRYTKSGFRTKAEAEAAQAEGKKLAKQINTAFIDLCNKKLDDVKVRSTDKHYKECQQIFKIFAAKFATTAVTKANIRAYINELAEESIPKANKYLRRLRSIFSYGIDNELISVNPMRGIKQVPYRKAKKYIPSEEDVSRVLAIAGEYKPYLLVLLHTAARVREVNNLKWEDVHADRLTLWSRKTNSRDLEPRDIPLNSVLKEVVNGIKPVAIKDGNVVKLSPFVFVNPRTKTRYDYRDKFLKTLCDKAGVEPFMFHALRHFAASLLSREGVGLTDIQNILGHSRATTTDNYLGSLKGSVVESLKKLEGIK